MHHNIITILLLLTFAVHKSLACSCDPYEPNFFKNVTAYNQVCIAVFDSINYSYNVGGLNGQTGFFRLLDTIGAVNSSVGNSIVVSGQDGLNCGENLLQFSAGDTFVLALTSGFYTSHIKDTFYLEGFCGKHFIGIQSGEYAGLTLAQIKARIKAIQNNQQNRCICPPSWDYSYASNITDADKHVLALFHRFDYGYNYGGLLTQTGYFTLLDTFSSIPLSIGDSMIVLGENGINCGQMLHLFEPGDTFFLALNKGNNQNFAQDTFYLKGGACGNYYEQIENGSGALNGLTIVQIMAVIDSIINPVSLIESELSIQIFPNPAKQLLHVESKNSMIESIDIFDMNGRILSRSDAIASQNKVLFISHLKPGIYALRVKTNQGLYVHKWIKN